MSRKKLTIVSRKVDNDQPEGLPVTRVRARGEDIRHYIIDNVGKHPTDISQMIASHFSITRQAVNKHLKRLISEGAVIPSGKTINRSYTLASLLEWKQTYSLQHPLAEDLIWTRDVSTVLGAQPDNVLEIW